MTDPKRRQMNARERLTVMVRTDRGNMTVWSQAEVNDALDAYRTEALAKAIGRLRAIPVTCTALTGPVWYGTGWNEAIGCLMDIADYREPDDENYPGELQRLRTLALAIRAALREGELAEVQRVMDAHVAWEKEATSRSSR